MDQPTADGVSTSDSLSGKNRPKLRNRLSKKAGAMLFLTSKSPSIFFSREHYEAQILKLCRYDETTIFQRHGTAYLSNERMDDADKKVLRQLCKRLLEFSQSSESYVRELILLAISDPLIYRTLLSILGDPKTGVQDLDADLENFAASGSVYEHWSEFIGQRVFIGCNEESLWSCCDALKSSFSGAHTYMSKEFLTYALTLELKGRELQFLLQVWRHFLHLSIENKPNDASESHWLWMNRHVGKILSSGKAIADFVSPDQLWSLRSGLSSTELNTDHVKRFFGMFFPIPTIRVNRNPGEEHLCVEFCYRSTKGWNLCDASLYAVHYEHNVWRNRTTSPGRNVLSDENWMALYHIADHVLSNYRRGGGFNAADGFTYAMGRDLLALAKWALTFLEKEANLISDVYRMGEARAAFYISQFIEIDRYCKKEVYNALRADTPMINLLNENARFRDGTTALNGLYDLAFIPQFRNLGNANVPSICFGIVRDGLPEPPNVLIDHLRGRLLEDVSVDTMLLDGHTLVCLRFYGRHTSFHSTGHYPIVAGYQNISGLRLVPLYVAAVRSSDVWFFTCVGEGELYVTYTDEVGDAQTTHDFFVLALRYNPSDLSPPYPRARQGAMDPTGPVFWLKFWPEKDLDYFDDPRLTDDCQLESFLDGFRL